MNKIVREPYPAPELPSDLRERNRPSTARVEVTVRAEDPPIERRDEPAEIFASATTMPFELTEIEARNSVAARRMG